MRVIPSLGESIQRIKNLTFQASQGQDEGFEFYTAVTHHVHLICGTQKFQTTSHHLDSGSLICHVIIAEKYILHPDGDHGSRNVGE